MLEQIGGIRMKIQCSHCGYIHAAEEVKVTKTTIDDGKISYKYYDAHCVECGKSLGIPKLTQRNIDSRERAIKAYNSTHQKRPYAGKCTKPSHIIRAEAERIPNECAIALAKAIIFGAKFDYKFKSKQKEVKAFFNSQWGHTLCDAIGRDANHAIENLDKPLPKEFYKNLKI